MRAILKRDHILFDNSIVPIRTNVKVIHYDKTWGIVVMELPLKYEGLGWTRSLLFPELESDKGNYFYMNLEDVLILDKERKNK